MTNILTINERFRILINMLQRPVFYNIHLALALFVIAWMNIGIFTFTTPYIPNFIRWGIFVIWLVLAFIYKQKFFQTLIKNCWPLIFFAIYILGINIIKGTFLSVEFKSIFYLLIVYSIFLYYFKEEHQKYQGVITSFLFFDFVLTGINTYIHLQKYPLVSRILSTTPEVIKEAYGNKVFYGVGSYGYIYALVSLLLLMFFLLLNHKKKKLVGLLFIAFSVLLVKASFTLAVLYFIFFICLLGLLKLIPRKTLPKIGLAIIALLPIFPKIIAIIFTQLSRMRGISKEISVRFNELALFFSGNEISGTDLIFRLDFYSQSLDAFFHNILFGTEFSSNTIYEIGGHSAWLDLFAQYGLSALLFFIFLYKAYKSIKTLIPGNYRIFYNLYWLYYLCLGFTNTLLFANIYIMWFMFLPMAITRIYKISNQSSSNSINMSNKLSKGDNHEDSMAY